MAYNVGFAQVTVTPVFTGMQRNITRQINRTFPAAGRQAQQQMARGFAAEAPRQRGLFNRAFTSVGSAASGVMAAAGATSAARFTERATAGLTSGMGRMTGAMRGIGTALTATMTTAGTTAGRGFTSSLMASLGPIAAIFGAGSVLTSGLSRLTGIENARAQLLGLGHTAETVDQIMENALASVKGTPYALNDAATAAAGLVAAGVEPGKELEGQLKNIADAATIANVPLNEMSAIWNKIAASDRLQGEELAQLGDRGIPILQMLSEHLGVSVEEVRKLASEGKINFETFSAAMHANLSGAALEAANTTTGAFSNLKAALGRLGAEILSALGFDSWKDAILGVIDVVDNLTDWIKENKTLLSSYALGIAGVSAAAYVLRGAINAVRGAFTLLTRHPIIAILSLIAGTIIYLWQTNEDFREALTAAWERIREVVSRVWENYIKPALEAFWSWIQESLVPALSDFWNNTVKPIFQRVGDWIKEVWTNTIQPALAELWSFITETLVPTLQSFWENVIKPVWELISGAIKMAWEKVILPALSALWDFIQSVLIPIMRFLYENVIKPVWNAISTAIGVAWSVIKAIFQAIKWYLDNVLGPVFRWLLNNVIKPVWSAIEVAIDVAWAAVKLIFDAMKGVIENVLAPVFRWFRDKVIKPVWDGIKNAIKTVWNDGIKPIFTALGNFIEDTVAPAFRRGVDIIKSVWEGLKEAAAAPINFVIETVYMNGIKKVFDTVAEKIGSSARLPSVRPISVGSSSRRGGGGGIAVAARARGGFTPRGWTLVGEEGPELVNFTAPGRVYTAEDTRRMLGLSGENEIQRSWSTSNPPHGGPGDWLRDRWEGVKNVGRWVADGVRDAAGNVVKWVRGSLARAAEIILNPMRDFIKDRVMGWGVLGEITGGATNNAIDKLLEWIRGEDAKGPADPGGRTLRGALPHVNAAAWEVADAINPRMTMQAWNQSMHWTHRAGRAIDFIDNAANLRRVRDYLVANATRLAVTEVIYNWRRWTPARGWHPLRGGYGNDPGHVWHVHSTHAATPTYDGGGWLTPGVKTVANFTGKPEAVLTDRQWRDIHALAVNGGAGDIYNVSVEIDPKDLTGLRSVEEFTTMLRRRTRQRNGG